MSSLSLGTVTLPSASLGPANPLPPLTGAPQLHANVAAADLDDEMRVNLEHGRVASLLPYLLQDRYDRVLVPRDHRVAVLENDRLVGKIDATADHPAGVLRVRAVHEDVPFTAAMRSAVDDELHDLARWLGLVARIGGR